MLFSEQGISMLIVKNSGLNHKMPAQVKEALRRRNDRAAELSKLLLKPTKDMLQVARLRHEASMDVARAMSVNDRHLQEALRIRSERELELAKILNGALP